MKYLACVTIGLLWITAAFGDDLFPPTGVHARQEGIFQPTVVYAQPDTRPEVWMFVTTGCPPHVTAYPTFYWTLDTVKNKRFHSGYTGLKPLMEAFEASRSVKASSAGSPDGAPTPTEEVDRVIRLLPNPELGFVEFGCGSDARWCVAAVRRWGCRATGIEIDPIRAIAARNFVRDIGLEESITIIEGDASERLDWIT